MEKRLLISEHWIEDEESVAKIEDKIKEFITSKLLDPNLVAIPMVDMYIDEDMGFKSILCFGISFPELMWKNGLGDNCQQSVSFYMDEKGLQAFWIDNKFESRYVYEQTQGCPVQGDVLICDMDGWELLRIFEDYMLTC